jgi:RNA polymerase sigma-70 factor (ECF subfamily)
MLVEMLAAMADAFTSALDVSARPRFDGDVGLADTLALLRAAATAAFPDIDVGESDYASELARRLGPAATPELLARVRADHVHLAIACARGDAAAIRRFESEFLDEVDACAKRMRARDDQADEIRSYLRRTLFVSEPGRNAALGEYSGRGDLRSYLRVIATREFVRVIDGGKREIGIGEESFLDKLSPVSDPELGYLRDAYRADVDAAMRIAVAKLSAESRALLRYSLVDGWSIDRIAKLYGIHRATAARRVATVRDELGELMRIEIAARLAIPIDEVDSVVRLVQSRVDLSLSRLLG